ncbi:chromosome transmission fidelity protein 18-like protein [Plakobranchus ocellatus]|uniref:Chromosome transmission fidelity protein 18-like protein n=1 Tax=Plakobranchus ocellatus TaxID=259542 RepID=A0AAV4D2V2_9GAST|nr:chromosome transmission fidelity protein 18-like protein [Plakobranchus ocellatus]
MDDSFELEYADELDALDIVNDEDVVPPPYSPPKSKRSLVFATPKEGRVKANSLAQDDKQKRPKSMLVGLTPPSSPEFDPVDDIGNRKRLQSSPSTEGDEIDGAVMDSQMSTSNKRPRLTEENCLQSDVDMSADAAVDFIRQYRGAKGLQRSDARDAATLVKNDLERPKVHKHIPKGDFMSTLGYEGQRVYMQLWDEDVLESELSSFEKDSRHLNLLPTPVCILKEQIEDLHTRKVIEEADEIHESLRRQLDTMEDDECIGIDETSETNDNGREKEKDDIDILSEELKSLWVEKYAPRKYTELLSEESINRSLLHWLKLWDYVVFGKDVPKPMKKGANKLKKEKEAPFKNKKFLSEVAEQLDKHHRPEQKIALLCGPPGLGKTTLAHIVAKHAGYNVVEMNASDDRSVDVFRNKIESATQMKSVMEADPRPNCLVIDEIDGAPAPAINVLLNLIKRTDVDAASEKKKKKKEELLLRPIICVCNDQYVPALRQLRQMALILNFPQTESSKLASRLHEVVKLERLKADLNALLALCERTDNDIRSCLNTLQFVRQNHKELTLRDVQTMSVGQKDSQKSLFSVWNDIFTMPRPKKNRFVSIHDLAEGKQDTLQVNNISPSARFQHILDMCQAAGETDRVMQGIHENYLEAKAKDPHLFGLNIANDWLCFSDCINQYIARNQDFSMLKFSSYLPVTFHFLYATYNPSRVQFPHEQFEAKQKQQKTLNLLNSLLSDMAPLTQKFTNSTSLTLDLLSPMLDILQPTMRPVNTQLYSSKEKEDLSNVVNIMIAYNMTYHQEKTPDGQYVYALDPNMEEVIKFPGSKQRKQLTYGAKQMIAREIALEKMRRAENARTKEAKAEVLPTTPTSVIEKNKSKSTVPNHLQKLEAKSIVPQKASINFFGNLVRTKREKNEAKASEAGEMKQDKSKRELLDTVIWFHFKEGFSNAVRRNVKVEDLL